MWVSFATKGSKQIGKGQLNYGMCGNELGQKKSAQKIPLTSANGRLNNKQIVLRGVVTKEKRELRNLKGIGEMYELKQLPTCNMQLLEYNLS